MNQLSSITPLEIILIGFAAVGIFLFFRACWRNIKRSRQHLSLALLTLMMSLTAQTAWATTFSTIKVGGTDYTLFTGFTATAGTEVDNVFVYENMVDGNLSSSFHAFTSPAYVEFNSDDPIIPKGYIFNTYDASNWKPTGWVLKAKANTADEWTTLSSKSGQSLASGQEFQYACDNNGNNAYKYFRFEVSNSNNNIWLTEIRLYGNMSYTHISVKAATCTETGIKQECWRRTDGKYFTDGTGTTELAESDVIAPMIPHTAVHYEATSTNIQYWQCSVCGKYFSDSGCTTEITEAETHSTVFGALSGGCYTLTSQTYTLTTDVNTDGYIYVPTGVTATIDLAGHTIDRGLTSAVANGYVIKVAGTLTLTDSSTGGTVKGGMHDEYTSCVYVPDGGTFTLAGGTLIGNTSNEGNRAVYVAFSAHFIMTGGKITGDVCGINASGHLTISGGEISGNSQRGIYPGSYSISVSGNPRITGNGDVNVNLYYNDAARLTVTGALTEGASIGITPHGTPTANAPVTVTSGYGTYNTASPDTYFTLDNNSFVLGWNEDRTEVAVGTELYTVGFDMNGHGSAIDAVSVLSGCKVLEPTAPTADGWYFVGWFTDADCTAGNEYDFDNAVTSNMTLHAKWTQTAIHSIILPENMVIVSADQEAVGGKYPVGTNIRFKVKSADYVVDGDVSDGTNALTADGDGIYTVTMGDADITIIATIKKAAEPNVTLSGSDNYTANDDDVLTGSTSGTLTIPDGAKVTLSDVTISGGIVCSGTATITLVGTNSVSVSAYNKAGIQIGGSGKTLTIKGNGSLNATGGSAAAGIGLGRTWDDNATGGSVVIEGGNITASGGNGIGAGTVGNSKTATIGDIVIKGGTVNARLGKGEIVGVATANIGAIIIYDTIEKVDASKITESVTYMHDDTDVTASASTYFTIIEDGDRRIITPKDNTDYTITIAGNTEHGTIACAATTAKYGDKITITATPDFGYRLSRLVVKDAQNKSVASMGNSFTMPQSNVTVSAVFELGTHGTTEFAWGYQGDYYQGFVTEATIYDGVTTVNLQTSRSYNIIKNYDKLLIDNDEYQVSIPYSGGTGTFVQDGTSFSLANNATAGFYDVTMNEAGNGKWSVSIQKTVPAMDDVPDQEYTGSEITPEPLVLAGSLNLTKGTDYEYSYTNNTNVGTAKVIVTFQGDYASLGSVEKEFTILPSTVMVSVTGSGTVTCGDRSATDGTSFGVMSEKGASVVLTLAPTDGYAARSVAYGYTNNSGTTASGIKLPISGTTATLTVPDDLKDGTGVTVTVTFAPALNGGADEASAVALTDATVTDLGGGWYKVDSDISFDHTLNLLGDTHLIIADGKTMTVNTASNRGIYSDYTLFVSGEGALNVTTTSSGIAVCVGNYVQTGATVTASGYIGIRCKDDFLGFDFDNDFTFSGGQLTATGSGGGGIDADNDITLSCTNATDFIQASSYASGTVKVADGKALTDGTVASNGMNGYSGTLTNEQRTAIGGKTLHRAVTTSYVDATGTLHENVIAIPLDNTMTTLAAGWYVVNSDVAYTSGITTTGDVKLILGDGCTMSFGKEGELLNATIIECNSHNLTIYGQSGGTGWLKAYSVQYNGIHVNNYTQYSGNVLIFDGNGACIYANNSVTLLGGTLDVQSGESDQGEIYGGSISILGGKLWARNKGLWGPQGITLGYTNTTDQIYVKIYHVNGMGLQIANGKTLVDDYGVIWSGALDNNQIEHDINGRTLKPLDYTGVTLTKEYYNVSATFSGSSETTVSIPVDVNVTSVTYNRTFTEGKPSTVMLPFSLGEGQTLTGGTLYKFTGVTKNETTGMWEATMTETATLQANTPYLLMPNNELVDGKVTFNLNWGTVTLNTTGGGDYDATSDDGAWKLVGSYNGKTWEENDPEIGKAYLIGDGGELLPVTAGTRIRPTECYVLQKKLVYGPLTIIEDENGKNVTINGSSVEDIVNCPEFTAQKVTYTRTFTTPKATIVLPFAVSQTDADAAGTFYKFYNVTSEFHVQMQEVTDGLDAGVPYIVVPKNTTDPVTFETTTPVAFPLTEPSEFTGNSTKWTFNGRYSTKIFDTLDANELVYFFAANEQDNAKLGDFVKVAASETTRILPFRAYIRCADKTALTRGNGVTRGFPATLPVYAIGNDGNETTQIGTISIEMDDDDWYSLDGRKLSGKPNKKGLYIHKGKKVLF